MSSLIKQWILHYLSCLQQFCKEFWHVFLKALPSIGFILHGLSPSSNWNFLLPFLTLSFHLPKCLCYLGTCLIFFFPYLTALSLLLPSMGWSLAPILTDSLQTIPLSVISISVNEYNQLSVQRSHFQNYLFFTKPCQFYSQNNIST